MDIALGEIYSGVFSVSIKSFDTSRHLWIPAQPQSQTSDKLWEELHVAGEAEYDRFWRMPLDEDFGPQIYSSNADLCNVRSPVRVSSPYSLTENNPFFFSFNSSPTQTGGRPGGSCTAALFLKAFVDGIEEKDGKPAPLRWAHIDIAGTMDVTRPSPYQFKGMTGRPTR